MGVRVTGTASDAAELLNELGTQLEGQDWTVHRNESLDGVTGGWWLAAEPPSSVESPLVFHWVFHPERDHSRWPGPYMLHFGSTSYEGDEDWDNQPGSPPIDDSDDRSPESNKWGGPFSEYQMHVTESYAYLAAVNDDGNWRWTLTGVPVMATSIKVAHCLALALQEGEDWQDDEEFVAPFILNDDARLGALPEPDLVWVDQEAWDFDWSAEKEENKEARWGAWKYRSPDAFFACLPLFDYDDPGYGDSTEGFWGNLGLYAADEGNSDRGIMLSLPIVVAYPRSKNTEDEDNSGQYWLAGWLKDIRFVNMEQYSAGEEIEIGGETWHVFPWYKWTGNRGEGSGPLGFAMRDPS